MQHITQNCKLSGQISHFLSEENINRLKSVMYSNHFLQHQYLFHEGEPAKRLFFVNEGQVKIVKLTDDGKELILYILQEGDMFCEFGGFGELNFTFSAQTLSDSNIGIIEHSDLEMLIYQHGDFAVEFLKWMSLWHRKTESKFRDLLLFGKSGALASTLIRLSNTCGKLTEDGILLDMKLTNTDLANLIGTTRESVNRLLSKHKDDGIISMKNGLITIHKLNDLKTIVSCPDCPVEICRI
ncbi:Crp/Fnr family transcriptional regulator [Chengkuizengella axinellae]|uniref:Crp/Fnr family transcriptional regulator n=1 Tax=Chengkuizengella axinellae TaxID=3064388 RepID=A0ABT9IUU6_9BACL|nr:Crp/Fnr family transcriptional regulator [Chengkuizengella sp. 2205SS18-9]MDP5272639.1 Crp/Fnr family transcriptional regulator [Chengkuizengella sp. 2205SS18-9]